MCGFNIFGCFYYGCLLPLSSPCAGCYPLDNGQGPVPMGTGTHANGASDWHLLLGLSVAAVASASSQGPCWAGAAIGACLCVFQQQPMGAPRMVGAANGARSWFSQKRQWPASVSGACNGSGSSCPPPELTLVLAVSFCLRAHAGKEPPMAVPHLSSCAPQQWRLASLFGLGFFCIHPQLPHSSPFRLSPRSQPQSSPRSDL